MTTVDTLTERQKDILRSVITCFIRSATPVGSERLAKDFFVDLSPATIRNVLAELEDKGYIDHPYTSAGRIPTDMGYRMYVDNLMTASELSSAHRRSLEQCVASVVETEEVLQVTSKMLGRISHQLSIVSSPRIGAGVLEKLELVSLSSTKVLVILTMKSGLVKTITMEVSAEIRREKLDNVSRSLNERIAGLTLMKIRETFADRIKDLQNEETGLIQLFIYSSQKLFDAGPEYQRLYISGAKNVFEQPEFENPHIARSMVDLLENEEAMIHILEQHEERNAVESVSVTIGSENRNKKLEHYSIIVSAYRIGDVSGTLGLIGPKRMNYAKAVPLVDFASQTISNVLS